MAAAVLVAVPVLTASATPTETRAEPAALIPKPVSQQALAGETFELDRWSQIGIDARHHETLPAYRIADQLARQLRRSTGFPLPVTHARRADISLSTDGPSSLGAEGYRLRASDDGVDLVAHTPEGLFRGVTTLRQLLPPKADAGSKQPGPWEIAGTSIADSPRYGHRGTMLDVSRHFFSVAEVKRYIDLASRYKLNKLHLHLSDDQGWRITIDSWPRLTTYGGSTEVGGTPGGWYTKRDFAEIVRYAADHYMTVIPEIDTPGHTNAALASYAELNCDGVAPPLYTGTAVGFSSLCTTKEITYQFLDDVFREVSQQAPGPLLHLGGDEAHVTPHEEYLRFVPRASALVNKHGKKVMGWQEIAETPLPSGSVAQYWGTDDERSRRLARMAAAQGAKVVLSPANRIYLDMKYDPSTPYGLSWAGFVNVQKSYSWNPSTLIPDLPESAVAGVEAPVWSETLDEIGKVEFMAFPRLAGVSELGWSPASALNWDDYRNRLGGQAPRWSVLGVNYFRAPEIPWRS
jgi:hexosaminidase